MGKNSKIQWTHHTFNPWWGCTKVSLACKHCYAETWSRRVGSNLWGSASMRRFFGDNHWREPIRWNRESERNRQRKRVFCASMGDVFEARPDLDPWRRRLWNLIEDTPWLDWLLLTKRPSNVETMVPWCSVWPHNVWLGITAETQELARQRIPILVRQPAVVKFVSCEPLLGPIELTQWLNHYSEKTWMECDSSSFVQLEGNGNRIHWVVVGGESGSSARPTHPSWVRSLRDQCLSAGIPFHFKQWGCWRPLEKNSDSRLLTIELEDHNGEAVTLIRRGKRANGRDLDGRTWDGVPTL